MGQPLWKKHFFETTRGRAVKLLRSSGRTVDELAQLLGISGTSVRAHLSQLENDGMVQHVARRGSGKPTQVYSLVPEAEAFFHKAYGPLLAQVLHVLDNQLPPAQVAGVMRQAGVALAAGRSVPVGDVRTRTRAATAVLAELGGIAEVEQRDDHTLTIRGLACPLATITAGHSEACLAVEGFLEALIGAPVTQCCDRGEGGPKCRFNVELAQDSQVRNH